MGSIEVLAAPCRTEACEQNLAQLVAAADHCDVIGMAKGIIVADLHRTPDEASAMLLAASQRENVRVYDLALRLVTDATEAAA